MGKALKLKPKDAEALEDFLRRSRNALGRKLVEVKLFGSKVRDEDTADSDIDVLVVVKDADVKVEDQIIDIAFDVNLKHEVYISPRVVARAVLDDPVWKITPFLQAIAREGISL